jgi:hypothetical protein
VQLKGVVALYRDSVGGATVNVDFVDLNQHHTRVRWPHRPKQAFNEAKSGIRVESVARKSASLWERSGQHMELLFVDNPTLAMISAHSGPMLTLAYSESFASIFKAYFLTLKSYRRWNRFCRMNEELEYRRHCQSSWL